MTTKGVERVRVPHGVWLEGGQVKAGSVGTVLARTDRTLSVKFDCRPSPIRVPASWTDAAKGGGR